jgi:hypothetical protein
MQYTVVIIPSPTRTRVLLTQGCDELLRAILPPPSSVHHERSVIAFLQGLSQWLDAKLRVVLSVDERAAGFCLALTDEMGLGRRSVFFDVEVHDPRARRRGRLIRGIGDFTDLRQLYLRRLGPDEN